jgi:hypothetical protein
MLRLERGDNAIIRILSENNKDLHSIRFIKCDVEGFEPQTFEGLKTIISTHKPIVFFESNIPEKGQASVKLLKSYGYENFYEFRRNDYPCSTLKRELRRIFSGESICPAKIDTIPIHSCDILAAHTPL